MKPWEKRLVNEYYELKERTFKLKIMLDNYANDSLDFTPKCSYNLLYEQYIYMMNYLSILEKRVKIENIEL